MAEVVNTVVSAVAPRTVTRKSDGQQITLWEVTDGQGVVWVARKDVATIAQQMLGQPVTMGRRTEQKGEYTNRYLDYIEINLGSVPMPQMNPVVQAQQAQAGQNIPPIQTSAASAPVLTEKDKAIHRQVAAKVAASIQGNDESMLTFWSNCVALARYFDTAQVPLTLDEQPAGNPSFYDTPPPHDDDSIPF